MAKAMRVDVVPLKYFAITAGLSVLILLGAIILGATGPDILEEGEYFAYHCYDFTHEWDPSKCNGVQPKNGGWTPWMGISTNKLNKLWYLVVTPYNTKGQAVNQNVRIEVSLEGMNYAADNMTLLVRNTTLVDDIICLEGSQECLSFILLYEDNIDYDLYLARVKFLGLRNDSFLGDVKFEFFKQTVAYSQLTIALRVIFSVAAVILFFAFFMQLRSVYASEKNWTGEQKAVIALIVCLFLFNNPLYPADYAVSGWFLVFMNAFFELIFYCAVFLFWFLVVEQFKGQRSKYELTQADVPKILAVLFYGLMSTVLYIYSSIRDRLTPIFTVPDHVTLIQVVYYLVGSSFILIVFWIGFMFAMSINSVASNMRPRFLYFSVPAAICIVSVIVGIFAGTVGPFGRNTISTVYYTFMWNIYVYLLVWGYWPVETGFGATNPVVTEAQPLFNN
eukprot:TRINITY_DN3537_c0_g1_i1.p1 TRINITY_DN3537_c0_g1~~TRINITY_DN3537_c0_g1_i1.p1  ORF type:complete len:448 (-),score=59.57 TRINITY_DN3537_c0_g1_i1:36-1379(-)